MEQPQRQHASAAHVRAGSAGRKEEKEKEGQRRREKDVLDGGQQESRKVVKNVMNGMREKRKNGVKAGTRKLE